MTERGGVGDVGRGFCDMSPKARRVGRGGVPAHHRGVVGMGSWCILIGYVGVGEDSRNNRTGGYVTGYSVLPSGGRDGGIGKNVWCFV